MKLRQLIELNLQTFNCAIFPMRWENGERLRLHPNFNPHPFGHFAIFFGQESHRPSKSEGARTPMLMGDVLLVWTAVYQTCLKRACVPRLLSGLYQLFHQRLIKHVLTVWPLTSTLACLVIKQCLMLFGRQTFPLCPGPKTASSTLI